MHCSDLDHYKEHEREWKVKEEAKMYIKEGISKSMKEFQCIPNVASLNYEGLCIHPHLDLLEGFKFPMFYTF